MFCTALFFFASIDIAKAAGGGGACNPNGNLLVFANYDGGELNINIDVNIPNLKIGVVSYENATINISGAFAGNVTEVIYAGFQGTNNNCGPIIPATTINGIAPANYSILTYPPVPLLIPMAGQEVLYVPILAI